MWPYVLFDLDGTLTDPKMGITKSVAFALNHFGITVENLDDLCCFIGPPLKESFQTFYHMDDAQADEAVARYREYFTRQGIYENAIFDGVDDMLASLVEQGKQVILATSKPAVYAQAILEHFNIAPYFRFVSGSELDGSRVKKAEVIAYALAQCGIVDLTQVVMVGDREHDIIGAKAIGVASIGVTYGYGSYEELQAVGAECIVATVAELGKILA